VAEFEHAAILTKAFVIATTLFGNVSETGLHFYPIDLKADILTSQSEWAAGV
jgi:hypothetical protein